MQARRAGMLAKLFSGKRAGTTLMVSGLVLAVVTALLVLSVLRRSQTAAAQGVRQVYVVMATQDVPEFTAIRSEAVAVKPFPAAFVPAGAVSTVDEVAGKYATTRLVRDQIVLSSQVSTTKRSANLSATIPPGQVAFWMPLPDLLAQSGGLQPRDRVDILLSLTLTGMGSQGKGITTQTTLQNVEVYFVGSASADVAGGGAAGQAGSGQRQADRVAAFLIDPQDAVLAKFIKDSGGTIDLVLRSRESQELVSTEAVTADTLVDRFHFRVPERWSVSR